MCLDDAARDGAADDIALVRRISSDRSAWWTRCAGGWSRRSSQELVYRLTSLFERAVWLVERYALLLEAERRTTDWAVWVGHAAPWASARG